MKSYTSAFALFKLSKDAVLRNPWPFLVIILLPALLLTFGDAFSGDDWILDGLPDIEPQPDLATAFHLGGALLTVLLLPAGFELELQSAKGKQPTLGEAFQNSARYFWSILALVLIVGLTIVAGLIALIGPGLIVITRYFLAPYFLADQKLGVQAAMKASWAASKGKAGAIWGIIGVMILLSLLQFIPLVGSLISDIMLTLYVCAPAFRYLELRANGTQPETET